MTNVVTEKLGWGDDPLPAPEDGAVPDTGTYVPRAEAKGSACDALATTHVPTEGRDGKVRIAIADGVAVGLAPCESLTGHPPAARRPNRLLRGCSCAVPTWVAWSGAELQTTPRVSGLLPTWSVSG
ncbi:hypothetical protein [Streptomyces sp. NBC_00286]|uniref:hypothetical protein n=1 Tax=Streptomyces sp. NBC_00286 TaxID=2975701 RepID=UPI002E294E4C|nr:hypothetical protein [Streptomyces sp. NBC_00286]